MDFNLFTRLWVEVSGVFVLMFLLSGVFLSVFTEIIKKQIFPKYTEEEKAEGKEDKDCPKWVGMLMGIGCTVIFFVCAVLADRNAVAHSTIPGGLWFLPIWFIGFYLWQWIACRVIKVILKALAPKFMTGTGRKKKVDTRPVYEVPKGAKVVYVEAEEETEATSETVE